MRYQHHLNDRQTIGFKLMQGLYDQYEFQLNREIYLELINLRQITIMQGSAT
jgi:hypothetical protein